MYFSKLLTRRSNHSRPTDKVSLEAFKQTWCAGDISGSDGNLCLEIFPVEAGASYTSDFRWRQKKKSKGLRFRKRGGETTCLPLPIHLPGCVAWRWLHTAIQKCAVAP
ncbi:hypothetical protein TNCV_4109431 [Trichonephila clavipes]|nr:hypothetical protein TNCV_4109431 [Trichonephila clavipes]